LKRYVHKRNFQNNIYVVFGVRCRFAFIWVDLKVKMKLSGLRERWYDLSGYEWKIYESLCMIDKI